MTPHSLLAPARLAGMPLLRSQSDGRLVDLARAGNDAAFEAIVARYRRPLMRHCTRMLSEERSEDVVQQAFLRALRAMRADERPLDLRPWLYTIAHNAALNALRDRTVPSDTLDDEIDGVERPEQAFERRQSLREVVDAVGALPERQRDALVLRELEGRSYDEIALKLGISDGAVRQLLNRARNTLRAGVTALTPYGLLARIPEGVDEPIVTRIAELTGAGAGAGAGAVATKVAATALVTGAVVGGVAAVPEEGRSSEPARAEAAVGKARAQARLALVAAQEAERPTRRADASARRAHRPGAGRAGDGRTGDDGQWTAGEDERRREDRSGPGSGDDERYGDSSGPGPGESSGPGSDGDSSGPGSVDTLSSGDGGSESSGPGDGDADSSGSGSGESGSSGSGSRDSGSGDSGSSGSGGGY